MRVVPVWGKHRDLRTPGPSSEPIPRIDQRVFVDDEDIEVIITLKMFKGTFTHYSQLLSLINQKSEKYVVF